MIAFIGDVHGKVDQYYKILQNADSSIQVGDLGIGFVPFQDHSNHYFIHGNHDNPSLCDQHQGFLGRYGYIKLAGYKIFYVSGARSIDRQMRTPYVDWWENEQLSYGEISRMLARYNGADIIVSHDCPSSIYSKMGINETNPSITAQGLNLLLKHPQKPKYWIFGHHHKSRQFWYEGIDFRCLQELEVLKLLDKQK